MVLRSEAVKPLNLNKSNNRPILRTVKDTIQITNSGNNIKPSTPTINNTIILDKPYIQLSKKTKELDANKLHKSVVDQKSDKNTKITKSRSFIEKNKKIITDKNSNDLLENKKLAEQKTTNKFPKASAKQKIIHVQDECRTGTNLPTESNNPKVDQTWSPPPKVINLKKTLVSPINLKKYCKTIFDEDEFLNAAKNIDTKSTKYTYTKISKHTNTIPQTKLIDKKTQVREVKKPEHLFSKLNLNNDYELIDKNIFDISIPEIVDIDTSLFQKNDNVKQIDIYQSRKTEEENGIFFNSEPSEINISTKILNAETQKDLQLPIHSNAGEIIKSINHLAERQDLLIDRCLPSKNHYSESTQTDDYNNLLSLFSSKTCSTLPMNFISVLKCKHNLQRSKKNYLESQKSNDLDINEHSISNKLFNNNNYTSNKNNVESTLPRNNVESTIHNILDIVDCDNTINLSNFKECEIEYDSNKSKYSLTNKAVISTPNNLSSNRLTRDNFCHDQINIVNNDEIFNNLNVLTNEDIKQILMKNNHDFDDLLTKNSSNDHILNSLSCCFPEIHDEFQAELCTLDQLNNSLGDIEKMGCDMSFKTNELSIDEEFSDHCTLDSNLQTMFTTPFSDNNSKQKSFLKLNSVSSNIMSVDKTITGLSIQMFEQFIKDEELRANQHRTILCLREKSLMNRLKWEVTKCDVQLKHFKLQPGQVQLIKQKQRGRVKKLEQSLSQVVQLGRTIDSLYKQRLIMLNEQLQHLKMQSSSKKIIRKLKNLDRITKKDGCRSINPHLFNQFDNTPFVNAVESKQTDINSIELNATSKNSTSPIKLINFELNKPKINLRNQATSPIDYEPKPIKKVENVQIQTNPDLSLKSMNDKSVQTSETPYFNNNNEDIKLSASFGFSKNHKLCLANLTKDNRSTMSSTKPVKLNHSPETSLSSNTEQSDMDIRITTLQEQLDSRKLESFRLKKEQKKLRLENLKSKEQDLLKQIDLYDKKIEESKKILMVELEKKNIQVTKLSKKHDSPLKNSSCSIIQNVTNYENNQSLEKHSEQLNVLDQTMWAGRNKYLYQTSIQNSNNESLNDSVLLDKSVHKLQNFSSKSKENLDGKVDKYKNKSCEFSEENQIYEFLPLHKEPTIIVVDPLHGVQTEIDMFKSQSIKTLIPLTSEINDNLIKETQTNCVNEDIGISIEAPICKYSILNQDKLNTSKSQEFFLENNLDIETSTLPYVNINYNAPNENSSNSGNIQRSILVDFNKNSSGECEEIQNNVKQFEIVNNEIKLEDNYSPDFTSDENISEFKESYNFTKPFMMESLDKQENNEFSCEEERSVGEIMMEDNTFIDQFSDDSDLILNETCSDDKIDTITNNILNNLLQDTFNKNKSFLFSKKSNLNIGTVETPLLIILEHGKKEDFIIHISEQTTTISDILLKRHIQPLVSETLQMYLPRLNKLETEELTKYLKWSSERKKLKLSECLSFQDHISKVEDDESLEIFDEKYQEQKTFSTGQDENSGIILSQTKQEADKLKLEQMRIEQEIERLRLSEETLREIPNKPPPPYKSPTKKKALSDIPYTFDEIHKIVLIAANKLFNDPQSSMSENDIKHLGSNLHADYITLIFDYCKEIAQDTFIEENNVPIWKKPIKNLKQFRSKPKNPKDLSDMVVNKLNQILDLDECEEKVNKFVIKQMYEEKSKWIDFQMDEMDIKNDIVQNLMKKLISNTIKNIKTNFYLKFIG
ncbi:Hypothetical protein CINCED_3A023348 [Cinara cedri]|uniref:Centrosome-associated protein 350 n=1 Tax=Cinara cedri TaxID=506608 RepID=A0A5E4M0S9_9HEMI|nr:Hypothetical protein CINCED_3A023348 [Cinara cedri]